MKRIFILISTIFLALASAFEAFSFPLASPGIDSARTAVLVYDLRYNTPIVSANLDLPLVPASVMKAVTAASVLNLAGSDERFFTPVVAEGVITSDGTLRGNVVIKASGDPTIESEHFDEGTHFADSIAVSLKALGINRIEGAVIVDESDFVHTGTPAGWMKEDLTWPYGTDLHGANFRDNKFVLRMPSKVTEPHVPGLIIKHVSPKSRKRSVSRQDGSSTVTVTGRIPRGGWSERLSTPNPAEVMRHEVEQTIADSGIEITGKKAKRSGDITLVYTHLSPAFGDILRSMMYRSDNMMAEGMLRSLCPGGSREAAVKEEMKIWRDRGVNVSGVSIEDGSGLSRNDRLTARFLFEVLREMLAPEFGTDYTSLFPRAGLDGTMRRTLADTRLEGRVALKTGTMKRVKAYGGYCFDEQGNPTHIIIAIANNLSASSALKTSLEDLLLEVIK